MIKKIIAIAFLMSLVSNTSFANSLESLMKCAETKDSLVRLVCYDNVVKLLNKVESPSNINLASVQAVTKVNDPVAKVNHPVVNVNVQTKEEKFGSEHLASNSKNKNDDLKQVIFTVKSAKKVVHNKWKITFDNDQVWKQAGSGYIKLTAGDRVELSKGALSAIHLKKLGSKRSIRVRRTK